MRESGNRGAAHSLAWLRSGLSEGRLTVISECRNPESGPRGVTDTMATGTFWGPARVSLRCGQCRRGMPQGPGVRPLPPPPTPHHAPRLHEHWCSSPPTRRARCAAPGLTRERRTERGPVAGAVPGASRAGLSGRLVLPAASSSLSSARPRPPGGSGSLRSCRPGGTGVHAAGFGFGAPSSCCSPPTRRSRARGPRFRDAGVV